MDNYKNKYRIQSHRKPNWDYSADAHYFLTIVTQNRACNLGKIVSTEMKLSDFGEIVVQEWFRSFEIRDELILHQFILMPNHLHAIVEIQNKNRGKMIDGGTTVGDTTDGGTTDGGTTVGGTTVETHGRASLRMDQRSDQRMDQRSDQRMDQRSDDHQLRETKRHPPVRLPTSISSFIAGFKSAVNSKIDDFLDEKQSEIPKYNRNNHFFQPNYHDHIIRNEMEYNNISTYIINNPSNWNKDKFNG
jgi:REP element-mobilizing transposase RayT